MKRMEVNEGEHFAVSDKVIVCDEYESAISLFSKISKHEKHQVVFAFTFSGKLSGKERTGDATIIMPPGYAFEFAQSILEHLEKLVIANNPEAAADFAEGVKQDDSGEADGTTGS